MSTVYDISKDEIGISKSRGVSVTNLKSKMEEEAEQSIEFTVEKTSTNENGGQSTMVKDTDTFDDATAWE